MSDLGIRKCSHGTLAAEVAVVGAEIAKPDGNALPGTVPDWKLNLRGRQKASGWTRLSVSQQGTGLHGVGTREKPGGQQKGRMHQTVERAVHRKVGFVFRRRESWISRRPLVCFYETLLEHTKTHRLEFLKNPSRWQRCSGLSGCHNPVVQVGNHALRGCRRCSRHHVVSKARVFNSIAPGCLNDAVVDVQTILVCRMMSWWWLCFHWLGGSSSSVLVDVTLFRWINHRGGGLQRPSVCHSFKQAE
jgi:hypothetical protein